jgi:hypothetical protein
MVVTRIAPVSLAKVLGCIYAVMGLVFGLVLALIASVAGQWGGATDTMPPFMAMMFGVGSIVTLPIVYGVLGFVGGVLTAAVYNVVARAIGGIEIDVRDPRASSAAP